MERENLMGGNGYFHYLDCGVGFVELYIYIYVGVRPSEKVIHYLCTVSQRHIQKLT